MTWDDSFTEAEYAELLHLAATKYRFVDLSEAEKIVPTGGAEEPIAIWRHDVDYSPHRALAMAEVEAALGLRCVYHFLLTGRYYSVLEPEVARLIRRIAALGHHLGLHFDMDVFGVDGDPGAAEVDVRAAFERHVLETIARKPLTSLSFHNYTLNAARLMAEPKIAGLPNFSGSPQIGSFRYVSDSNGMWRHNRLRDVLLDDPAPRLLVLTHPLWWTPDSLTPLERLRRCISGRASHNLNLYIRTLMRDGRLTPVAERSGLTAELIAHAMGTEEDEG